MIDDSVIARIAHQTDLHGMAGGTKQLRDFARAMYLLGQESQRESDALLQVPVLDKQGVTCRVQAYREAILENVAAQ